MSISSRSTKAAMYSEIERLRSLLDRQEQQLRAQHEEIAQLRARLRAQREAAPQPRTMPARSTRHELMKRLAITLKTSVKWVDGQGFKQYKDGNWVAVPAHTIEFVSKNLEA